jgi:hypothetical protein
MVIGSLLVAMLTPMLLLPLVGGAAMVLIHQRQPIWVAIIISQTKNLEQKDGLHPIK